MAYKIFICYRRVDKELARGIADRLIDKFGNDAVFLDVEAVGGGREWRRRVLAGLEDDPVVVTLITTKWNSLRGGQRKLLDKSDHIRFELEAALERGLSVLPVLYERAVWPKEDQLPPPLKSLLRFQRVPFSNERWTYDANVLVGALEDLLGVSPDVQVAPNPAVAPIPGPAAPAFPPLPGTFSRSMFQESPKERKARAARAKKERERIERARAEADPFYARRGFWVAALLTFMLAAASLVGGEALAQVLGNNWTSLPAPPLAAGVLLVALWAIGWTGFGAVAYWYDPERGARVFYTRGLLGGYALAYTDFEPIGYWAAFPIPIAAAWLLARGIAWIPYNFWEWDYSLIFWMVLAAYTLPVFGLYFLEAIDEVDL